MILKNSFYVRFLNKWGSFLKYWGRGQREWKEVIINAQSLATIVGRDVVPKYPCIFWAIIYSSQILAVGVLFDPYQRYFIEAWTYLEDPFIHSNN